MSYQRAEEVVKAAGRYILRLGSLAMAMFAVDGWRYAAIVQHLSIRATVLKDASIVISASIAVLVVSYALRMIRNPELRSFVDAGKTLLREVFPVVLSSFVSFGYLFDCERCPLFWWISIVTIIGWMTSLALTSVFRVAPHIAECKAALKDAGSSLRQIWREHHEKSNDG